MSASAVALWLLICTPLFAFLRGKTIMTLWNWFVPAAIPSARPIGFWLALGIGGLVTFLTYSVPTDEIEDHTKYFIKITLWGILLPLLAMGAGWMYQHFM